MSSGLSDFCISILQDVAAASVSGFLPRPEDRLSCHWLEQERLIGRQLDADGLSRYRITRSGLANLAEHQRRLQVGARS